MDVKTEIKSLRDTKVALHLRKVELGKQRWRLEDEVAARGDNSEALAQVAAEQNVVCKRLREVNTSLKELDSLVEMMDEGKEEKAPNVAESVLVWYAK